MKTHTQISVFYIIGAVLSQAQACTDDTSCASEATNKKCNTAATPAVCVQCLTNVDCSGATPECNTGTNVCQAATTSVRIKLGGGSTANEGYVMAQGTNGTWGGVCDSGWDVYNAHVVCQELFGTLAEDSYDYYTTLLAYNEVEYGFEEPETKGVFILDQVSCTGFETSIFNCNHSGEWNANDCAPAMIAGVKCKSS